MARAQEALDGIRERCFGPWSHFDFWVFISALPLEQGSCKTGLDAHRACFCAFVPFVTIHAHSSFWVSTSRGDATKETKRWQMHTNRNQKIDGILQEPCGSWTSTLKLVDVRAKGVFSCSPGNREKAFDPQASGRKSLGLDVHGKIQPKVFKCVYVCVCVFVCVCVSSLN